MWAFGSLRRSHLDVAGVRTLFKKHILYVWMCISMHDCICFLKCASLRLLLFETCPASVCMYVYMYTCLYCVCGMCLSRLLLSESRPKCMRVCISFDVRVCVCFVIFQHGYCPKRVCSRVCTYIHTYINTYIRRTIDMCACVWSADSFERSEEGDRRGVVLLSCNTCWGVAVGPECDAWFLVPVACVARWRFSFCKSWTCYVGVLCGCVMRAECKAEFVMPAFMRVVW
jgi:hypothetical protein